MSTGYQGYVNIGLVYSKSLIYFECLQNGVDLETNILLTGKIFDIVEPVTCLVFLIIIIMLHTMRYSMCFDKHHVVDINVNYRYQVVKVLRYATFESVFCKYQEVK